VWITVSRGARACSWGHAWPGVRAKVFPFHLPRPLRPKTALTNSHSLRQYRSRPGRKRGARGNGYAKALVAVRRLTLRSMSFGVGYWYGSTDRNPSGTPCLARCA
jgi:hypothetical protein